MEGLGYFLKEIEHHGEANATTLPAWLDTLRDFAAERFGELGLPTTKDEDWRWTNIAPISRGGFQAARQLTDLPDASRVDTATGGLSGPKLVLVNGIFAPKLSTLDCLPQGLRLRSLAQVLAEDPDSVETHLCRYANSHELAFAALNTAFLQDGAVLELAEGAQITEPISIVCLTTASAGASAPIASYPRLLIVAGEGSRATIIERFENCDAAESLTNSVTEIVLERRAAINHIRIQNENADSLHVNTLQVEQAGKSAFRSCTVSLGARLTRNDTHTKLNGEGALCELNALYALHDEQHVDNQVLIDHAKPNCTSSELFKGILDDSSRAVFSGRVIVRPDAQKTSAEQSNMSLLLSDRAEADSKPQLEIYADDVKCTHGATSGSLDEEALFYLRSRGVGPAVAKAMLTQAFGLEVIDKIEVPQLHAHLVALLRTRLEETAAKGGAA